MNPFPNHSHTSTNSGLAVRLGRLVWLMVSTCLGVSMEFPLDNWAMKKAGSLGCIGDYTSLCYRVYYHILYLEPQTTICKWMFGETTISYINIWNYPIETTIYKWLFGVPGRNPYFNTGPVHSSYFFSPRFGSLWVSSGFRALTPVAHLTTLMAIIKVVLAETKHAKSPETKELHLKMDGWNISFLFGWLFRGELLVSGRVNDHPKKRMGRWWKPSWVLVCFWYN